MKKIFSLFAALTLSVGLWAEGSVFTYTATKKLETEFNQLGTVATHEFSNGAGTATYSGTVTTIGNYAFQMCTSLQSITIPASVTTIGKNAFEVCYSLTSVTFLGNACTIGKSAFNYVGTTDKPATLVLPANWTGEKPVDSQTAWYGGYFKLETPAPVEYKYTTYENWQIKYGSAWQWSGNMEKVEDGLFKLEILWEGTGFNVKSDANPIKQDWIAPEELTIGEEVIAPINVDVYLQVIDDETVKIGVGCKPAKPAPVVGETFEDETSGLKFEVTATDETNTVKVVYNSYAGTSYTIPATVTYNDVTFAVTEIGERAFYENSSLQSIIIPGNVTTIENSAFYSCYVLESITISDGVTTIGESAFEICFALPSITIPASVSEIGEYAFQNCGILTSVTFEGSSCTISNTAFNKVGFNNPATLVLPDNWTGTKPDQDGYWHGGYFKAPAPVVGETFEDETSGLKFEVTATGETNTVKVIAGDYAGTTYTVPATVTYKEVDFAVTEIGDAAFCDCSDLQSITLPAGVTTIGKQAFRRCTSLSAIELPASLTTIGVEAFSYCYALLSITLPANVTAIGASAFAYSALTSVTFLGSSCNIDNKAFNNVGTAKNPVTLNLPANRTGDKPGEDGSWYGGYFKIDATALPSVNSKFLIQNSKLIKDGQVIIRKGDKTYNALGAEL